MILYVNGDSFVAGSGLALDIIPGNSGNLSEVSSSKRMELASWAHKVLYDPSYAGYHPKIKFLERARAFPALIKNQIPSCKLINSSLGGSSFDRITRTTITDLIEIKKTHNDKIVAIIGNTDYYRKEIACSLYNKHWLDLNLGLANGWPTEPRDLLVLAKYFVREETSYHRLVEYYKNWITIKEFCKNNDIELLFLKVFNDDFEGTTKPKDLLLLEEYVNLQYTIHMGNVSEKVEKRYCPDGGHFSAAVHTLVAEEFVKLLEKYKE